jgi:glutamate racemase
LREVRARLPREDIVYFADQAHVPYGDREPDELRGFLAANFAFLESRGAEAVVMGCNTSCAIAARYGWPATTLHVFDLIDAAADAVVATEARRVGVIATTATATSGAYGDRIRARQASVHGRQPAIDVQEVAAPALVPLVESGTLEGPVARVAVAAVCADFELPLDLLVLACTHYPLLDAHFAAVLGGSVTRIDPALAQAERASAFVAKRGGETGSGRTFCVTTGGLEPFRKAVEATCGLLGPNDAIDSVVAARP